MEHDHRVQNMGLTCAYFFTETGSVYSRTKISMRLDYTDYTDYASRCGSWPRPALCTGSHTNITLKQFLNIYIYKFIERASAQVPPTPLLWGRVERGRER